MSPDFVEAVETATIFVTAALAIVSIGSAVYTVNIYRQRHEEALFLTRLIKRNVRVATAAAVILIYLALALSDYGLGRPWGAVVIAGSVGAMLYGPISDALLWHKERRSK